jgi:hypothetical protein
LGFEDTSNIMGIENYMQKVDRTNTIEISVWKIRSGSIRILGTYPAHSSNHQHDRMRSSKERISQLMEMEEDRILVGFYQEVQKTRDKVWHYKNIRWKSFKEGDLLLVYDNKFLQYLGKFRMHWLGPYDVEKHRWRIYTTERFARHGTERNDQ